VRGHIPALASEPDTLGTQYFGVDLGSTVSGIAPQIPNGRQM